MCSASFFIKEVQIETTMKYYYTYFGIPKNQKLTIPSADEDSK